MSKIVKVCKKHGSLTISQVYEKHRQSKKKGSTKYYICKMCQLHSDAAKKWRANNKEKFNEYQKRHYEKNKEYLALYRYVYYMGTDYAKTYYKKNKEKFKGRRNEYFKNYYASRKKHDSHVKLYLKHEKRTHNNLRDTAELQNRSSRS